MIFRLLYNITHNLIKENFLELIKRTFKKNLKQKGMIYIACDKNKVFFISTDHIIRDIDFGLVRMYVTLYLG